MTAHVVRNRIPSTNELNVTTEQSAICLDNRGTKFKIARPSHRVVFVVRAELSR